jgi:Pro-kumamolisin, activation domain/Bacterial Ig-like domain (group 3)
VVISKRLKQFASALSLTVFLVAAHAAQAQTQVPSRILSPIRNEERVTVAGSTSPLVERSVDNGRLAGGQNLGRMLLLLAPAPELDQQAQQLLAALHDASSPSFHKWLTPAQYGDEFGVAAEDATAVQNWLQTQGLTVHEIAQSRRFIVFSGNVAQVEQAFSTEMHSYSYHSNRFIANSSDVQIPAALGQVVRGVVRLMSEPRKPNLKIGQKISVNRKTGKIEGPYGLHFMGPADFATIYNLKPLYAAGIDGTGQTIAIVSRSSLADPNYGIDGIQDIRDFRNVMALPANDPQMIVNGDDPQVQSYDDTVEALLDITWAGAVAPGAHIIAVASQSNFADGVDISAAYIVDHNLAPIMSTSFGGCEQTLGSVGTEFYNSLWQQAAAQGMTAFVSAGDNGGAGCDSQSSGLPASQGLAVNGLASTPYNVAVGGTQFDDLADNDAYWTVNADPVTLQSALSYIPEIAWNESSNDPFATSLWAGSGGVSTIYAKPNWQSATGVPNDGKRDVPDISLAAAGHTGYALCFEGSCSDPEFLGVYSVGGTSASSPAAAGIMALVLQKMGGQPQGLANYVFYKLAAKAGVYHDIIKGDNKVPDSNGEFTVGYSTGPGYDLATGIGSFDANALVTSWASAAATAGSTTSLALGNGQATTVVHGTPITFKATVACSGTGCAPPTGEVSLLSTGTSSGAVLGVGAAALTTSAGDGIATIASPNVPGGAYGITARYSGDGKYYASNSNSLNVTVTPEASQMQMGGSIPGYYTQAPLSVQYAEPVTLWIAVAGASGVGHPTGPITLLVDGSAANTVTSDFQTPSTLSLNYGESSTVFGNGTKPTGQSSVLPNLAPGLTVGAHELQATYPGDNSFKSSQASYSVNITKADSSITDVFLLGTAVPNIPVVIEGQIALNNLGCAPYGGTVSISDFTSGTAVSLGPAVTVSPMYCDSFTFTTTFKTAGQHLVRAVYSGDSNVTGASSSGYLTVSPNSSSYVNLTADVASTVVGGVVHLSAQVQSDVRQYAATGSVMFLDGATTIGTVKLDGTGTANLAISTLAAGTHTLSVNYSGDAVLSAGTGGPITEMISDYTVQAQPASVTVASGQSGASMISVIPLGGSTQTVSFSCGTVATTTLGCAFSPASVTLDGVNPAAVKITVSAGSAAAVAAVAASRSTAWGLVSTIALVGLLLPFGPRKKLGRACSVVAIMVLIVFAFGCGGSGNSGSNTPQAGTYVLSVTASAGAGTAPKTIPLVITITK